eukprot:jgi/Chrzof1/13998/Cz08g20190.t1
MSVNVVLGAGGATGQECVKRLLAATTSPVRAVVRSPDKYKDAFPQNSKLEVVAGDVTDPESLRKVLKDAKGIIFAASSTTFWGPAKVDYEAVKQTAEIAKEVHAERVVLVSSMLTHPVNRLNPMRLLLNNIRWGLMDNKYKGEEALRHSGVPCTIIRPGGLSNAEAGKSIIHSDLNTTKELGGGMITRGDVAALCVEALTNPAASNLTVSVYTKKQPLTDGTYEDQLKAAFVAKPTAQ